MKGHIFIITLVFVFMVGFSQVVISDQYQTYRTNYSTDNLAQNPYDNLSEKQKELINEKLKEFRTLTPEQKKNALRRVDKDRDGKRAAVQERVNLMRGR